MPAAANALAQLHRLLGLPEESPVVTSLSIDDLRQWKPIAEQIARARKPEAPKIAELLVEAANDSGDQICIAYSHWIGGNIYHNLGLMMLADEAYRRASDLYTQIGDPLSIARMSVGWVHVLGDLTEGKEALECAQRAEEILLASGDAADKSRLANLYGNRGIVYEQMGYFVEALEEYRRKLAYLESLPDRTADAESDEALVLNDIGIVHVLMGQYNEAEAVFQSALARLSASAITPYIDADRTLVLMNAAWLKVLRKSPPAAVRRAFQEARTSRDRLVELSERLYFVHIELDEANYLIRSGRWEDVNRANILELRDQLIQQRLEFDAAFAALLLGQLDYHAGHLSQALALFTQIAADCPDKTPTLAYLAYLWQARALRASGDIGRAEHALNLSIGSIETTRRQLKIDDYRAGFLEDKLVAYHDMIDLYLELGRFEKALAVSESSKARTLTEAVAAGVQPDDTTAQQEETPTSANVDTSADFSIAAFAQALPAGTLAISYVEVHDNVWAFLVDGSGLVVRPIALGGRLMRADLETGLQRIERIVYEQAFTVDVVAQQTAMAQAALKEWWTTFVAPLQPWLDRYSCVLIAPDGLMNALPFASLYDEKNQRYFCETHEILLTPNLALWGALTARVERPGPKPADKVLVVGSSAREGTAGALPAAVTEAYAVAEMFGDPMLLLEREATLEQFVHAAPHACFIYIAAHGEYSIGVPASSFIELADGLLRVRDILALRLAAPVVILNACDTNKGHLLGNEMMGWVRGFLFAGASSIIAAHWQVEDIAASELMIQLVREVQAGSSLARALQRAQQMLIRRAGHHATHPFFWGSYSVTGAGRWPAAAGANA